MIVQKTKENKMNCPNCGRKFVVCAECGEKYPHGLFSHCTKPECQEVNAPLDCEYCGFTVCNDLSGILTLDMKLIPYKSL